MRTRTVRPKGNESHDHEGYGCRRGSASRAGDAPGLHELTTLVAGLTQKVQSAHWVGPDRERFVADWNSHHASALKSVAQALQDTSTRANQDAQQQDEASNA